MEQKQAEGHTEHEQGLNFQLCEGRCETAQHPEQIIVGFTSNPSKHVMDAGQLCCPGSQCDTSSAEPTGFEVGFFCLTAEALCDEHQTSVLQ